MTFIRKCPNCGEDISYSTERTKIRAIRRNTKCKSCSAMGKIFTDEHKKNIGKSKKGNKNCIGRKYSEETLKKMSNSNKGQKRSEEAKLRMRLSAIKKGIKYPNYNKNGCKIINWFNMYYGFNFQHAENGGEICIDGYWPDGLDEKQKTIMEIDEPRHFDNSGKLKQKDIQRQRYLEGLGYKFIRVRT